MKQLWGILIVLVLSCAPDVADTGSSSEVTNGFVVAVLQGGSPVPRCTVSIVHREKWYADKAAGRSPVVVQGITDSFGTVQFDSVPNGTYRVVAMGTDAGGIRSVAVDEYVSAETLSLESLSQLSGVVTTLSGSVETVALVGMPHEVIPDEDGSFFFPRIPGDQAEFVGMVRDSHQWHPSFGRGVTFYPGSETVVPPMQVTPDGVVLDDFNDGDGDAVFGWFTGHGKWYAYDDAGKGGNSQLFPPTVIDSFATALSDSGAFQGKSVHVTFVMGDAMATPHGSIACQFRENTMEYADLRDLRRISFRIKGRGSVRLNLITHAVDQYEPTLIRGDFGVTIHLKDTWEQVTVDLDTISPEPESPALRDGLQWKDVSDSVRSVVFGSWSNTPGDTVELFLDDIILHGIDPARFSHRE